MAAAVTAVHLKCLQIIQFGLFLNPVKLQLLWAIFMRRMCFQCLCGVTSNLSQPCLFLLQCYESKCHQHCLYSSGKVEQTRSLCVSLLMSPCIGWPFSHTTAEAEQARSVVVCVFARTFSVHLSMCITWTTHKSCPRQSVCMSSCHKKVRSVRLPWALCVWV